MPHIPYHPAVGLGELMPGWMVIPQNPLKTDNTVLVPTPQAAAGGAVYKPTIGELLPGRFVVPQNPIIRELSGVGFLGGCGCGGAGCKAGCGCASGSGLSGLGIAVPFVGEVNTNQLMLLGGAALLVWFMFSRGSGGSPYRQSMKSAREHYREEVREARSKYPRRIAV